MSASPKILFSLLQQALHQQHQGDVHSEDDLVYYSFAPSEKARMKHLQKVRKDLHSKKQAARVVAQIAMNKKKHNKTIILPKHKGGVPLKMKLVKRILQETSPEANHQDDINMMTNIYDYIQEQDNLKNLQHSIYNPHQTEHDVDEQLINTWSSNDHLFNAIGNIATELETLTKYVIKNYDHNMAGEVLDKDASNYNATVPSSPPKSSKAHVCSFFPNKKKKNPLKNTINKSVIKGSAHQEKSISRATNIGADIDVSELVKNGEDEDHVKSLIRNLPVGVNFHTGGSGGRYRHATLSSRLCLRGQKVMKITTINDSSRRFEDYVKEAIEKLEEMKKNPEAALAAKLENNRKRDLPVNVDSNVILNLPNGISYIPARQRKGRNYVRAASFSSRIRVNGERVQKITQITDPSRPIEEYVQEAIRKQEEMKKNPEAALAEKKRLPKKQDN